MVLKLLERQQNVVGSAACSNPELPTSSDIFAVEKKNMKHNDSSLAGLLTSPV